MLELNIKKYHYARNSLIRRTVLLGAFPQPGLVRGTQFQAVAETAASDSTIVSNLW